MLKVAVLALATLATAEIRDVNRGYYGGKSTPVVIWHGMGDNCCHSWSMGYVKSLFEKNMDTGTYVRSLMIGDSEGADTENGFFMDVNKQVELVCDKIAKDPNLQNGYHAVGFSQGGQFLRAVAQRCPQGMRTLVSFGGQHQGVYGLPNCLGENHVVCDYVRRLLNYGAYTSWVQNFLVQAQYWHDPLDEETYRRKSLFLADINNEPGRGNTSYATNLRKLEKFILVKFSEDSVVDPRETEWFGWYDPAGHGNRLVPMNETALYIEDRLGLKAMNEEGKLVFLESPGNHLHFTEEFLVKEIIEPYF